MMARPTRIERAHYEMLVGRKILGIHWEDFEGHALPLLVLSGKDPEGHQATAAVLCDPEGNGPGHLEHSL
ncbi:MAG: hypothetical protein WCS65_18285 [Verrucomicrobiae bacterium]